MGVKSEFVIPFAGLSVGKHDFEFKLDDAFFDAIDYSEIEKGNLLASVTLEKHKHMLIFEFNISGTARVVCDRCCEDFDLPVDSNQQLIVKFGESTGEENENIAFIPEGAYEIDISHYLYENIVLALPIRRTHDEGDCDPETIKKLEELKVKEAEAKDDDDIDPRWSALKNLN